jgi:hypothetical protein
LAALAAFVVVAAVVAFFASQLGLPRQTDLANVTQLLASNAVEKLDISGSTLMVTEKNGDVLRVEAVSADQFDQLATAANGAGVAVHASSGLQASWVSSAAFLATLLLPVVVIGGALLLIGRFVRRPPRIGYAG